MCSLFVIASLSEQPKPARAASMWVKGILSTFYTSDRSSTIAATVGAAPTRHQDAASHFYRCDGL